MDILAVNILTLNLVFSTLVFWIIARIYLFPKLPALEPRSVLVPILLLHAFRHLGMMFLASGAVYKGIPSEFAYPAAFGDLLAAVLALISLAAVLAGSPLSRSLLWIFNLEGSIDLLAAITLATIYNAAAYMGPAYWIPSLWVPALLVSHYITFVILLRPRGAIAR